MMKNIITVLTIIACSFIYAQDVTLSLDGNDLNYSSSVDIAGFQFNIENVVLIGASGGEAEANGLMVSTGNNTVLGFSLTGAVIPAGSGIFTTLEVEGAGACISGLILSDSSGNALGATIDDCLNIVNLNDAEGFRDQHQILFLRL